MTESKKEVRLRQVRISFIEAAKNILLEEGVNHVSVRKVADRVGYSYATIYNHFKDLNELLSYVKYEMTKDIANYMAINNRKAINCIGDIKYINRLHINYFVENIHVYEFFYNYKLKPFDGEPIYMESVSNHWKEQYNCFVEQGRIKSQDVDTVAKTMIYAINGILAILSGNHLLSVDDSCRDLDEIVEMLLG
jgi:AcrR family transcriptional regulator